MCTELLFSIWGTRGGLSTSSRRVWSLIAASLRANRVDIVPPRISVGPSWHVQVRDHLDGRPEKGIYHAAGSSMYPPEEV